MSSITGFRMPYISIGNAIGIFVGLILAAILSIAATPKMVTVTDVPDLETVVPRSFGDWREKPTPFVQVSLTTGNEPNMNQPYDQSVMRAYENSAGQVVYLALAWGERQRQEVKIHRPDLCYVAQGFKVRSLKSVNFEQIQSEDGRTVHGKHMLAFTGQVGEAVSYWMRIGSLYSEDAFETRMHILKEGIQGRIPDGILVRASARVRDENEAQEVWPVLDRFLKELVAESPESAQRLMIGSNF